jgi:hypothetical protein
MKVMDVGILDYFEDSTLSLQDWFDSCLYDQDPCDTKMWKIAQFWKAWACVSKHPCADSELRCEPRVAYNPVTEEHYFIFKYNNNGTTFLVGDSLPIMPEDRIVEIVEVDVDCKIPGCGQCNPGLRQQV